MISIEALTAAIEQALESDPELRVVREHYVRWTSPGGTPMRSTDPDRETISSEDFASMILRHLAPEVKS